MGSEYVVHKIPVEYGQFHVRPKVLDYLGLDAQTKEVAVHLLDRYRLSLLNIAEFSDEDGVYVIFPNEKLMAAVPCGKKKCADAKKTLEAIGIISQKKQGLNRPNKIYIDLARLQQLCEEHHTALDGAEPPPPEGPNAPFRREHNCATSKNIPKKNDLSKSDRSHPYSQAEIETFFCQWGLLNPTTPEAQLLREVLLELLETHQAVNVKGKAITPAVQRIAAQWCDADDTAEVLRRLSRRDAEKTAACVRDVFLEYLLEQCGDEIARHPSVLDP